MLTSPEVCCNHKYRNLDTVRAPPGRKILAQGKKRMQDTSKATAEMYDGLELDKNSGPMGPEKSPGCRGFFTDGPHKED